jgi:hypothetical protein
MLYRFIFFGSFSVLLYGIQLFWKSPLSPMFPYEVRNLIATGKIEHAVDLLEWRADKTWSSQIESDALWEAAQIVYLRLQDNERAKGLILRCLSLEHFAYSSEANALLASMYIDTQPKLSIQYWERAVRSHPTHIKVDDWRIRIARTHEELEQIDMAITSWKKVQNESYQSEKHLALGRLQLKEDPVEAYKHFNEVRNDKYLERAKTAELGQQLARWQLAYQQVSQTKKKSKTAK